MLKNTKILCLASAPWDGLKVNVQNIMDRLSQENQVLYVESTGLRAPKAGSKDLKKIIKRLWSFFKGLKQKKEGLFVLSPLLIPGGFSGSKAKINRFLYSWQVKKALKKCKMQDYIIWAYLPSALLILDKLKKGLLIYHIVDDYAANPGVNRKLIQQQDRELCQKADLVFTSSPALFDGHKTINPNCHLLSNVADYQLFKQKNYPRPSDLPPPGKPCIGFWGNLASYKIDLKLIAELASQKRRWNIVLIGPVGLGDPSTDISCLEKQSNVHLLGPRKREELPAYLSYFDLCLLPNQLNQSTKSVFPMKFYEYLAQGKPVVSVNLDALARAADNSLFYLSENKADFIKNCEKALTENNPGLIEMRIKAAKDNSWETRMQELSEIITAHLKYCNQN